MEILFFFILNLCSIYSIVIYLYVGNFFVEFVLIIRFIFDYYGIVSSKVKMEFINFVLDDGKII